MPDDHTFDRFLKSHISEIKKTSTLEEMRSSGRKIVRFRDRYFDMGFDPPEGAEEDLCQSIAMYIQMSYGDRNITERYSLIDNIIDGENIDCRLLQRWCYYINMNQYCAAGIGFGLFQEDSNKVMSLTALANHIGRKYYSEMRCQSYVGVYGDPIKYRPKLMDGIVTEEKTSKYARDYFQRRRAEQAAEERAVKDHLEGIRARSGILSIDLSWGEDEVSL